MSENNLIENGIYSFVDKNCEYYMVLIEKTDTLLIFLKIINDKIFKREDILTSIINDGKNEFVIFNMKNLFYQELIKNSLSGYMGRMPKYLQEKLLQEFNNGKRYCKCAEYNYDISFEKNI